LVALLLAGRPASGKTTVLRAAAQKLASFHPVGFYTEEIRVGRERQGFRLVTLDGEDAIIAHVDLPPPRVSTYGVDRRRSIDSRLHCANAMTARPST
jgi:nucleoside-triphosphatase THEP1